MIAAPVPCLAIREKKQAAAPRLLQVGHARTRTLGPDVPPEPPSCTLERRNHKLHFHPDPTTVTLQTLHDRSVA